MKITEYPKTESLNEENVFLVDGDRGTQGITMSNLIKSIIDVGGGLLTEGIDPNKLDQLASTGLVDTDKLLIGTGDGTKSSSLADFIYGVADVISTNRINIGLKRSLWRGKYLGNYVTDEQYKAIGYGTFKGLFLGDYWTINGFNWRIMDFNYWYNTGNNDIPTGICTTPHLVIIPDEVLMYRSMNDSNTTVGGYYNSIMRKTTIPNEVHPIINSAFGAEHILRHSECLTTGVTDGYPSTHAWFESSCEIPSADMILGNAVMKPMSNGQTVPKNQTTSARQLAGTTVNLGMLMPSDWYWLRDVGTASEFLYIGWTGSDAIAYASAKAGVRPVFGIRY